MSASNLCLFGTVTDPNERKLDAASELRNLLSVSSTHTLCLLPEEEKEKAIIEISSSTYNISTKTEVCVGLRFVFSVSDRNFEYFS